MAVRNDFDDAARLELAMGEAMQPSPSFSDLALQTQEEIAAEWREEGLADKYELFVAERDGRVVGHVLLYRRPPDLRVPENSIDLAQASTYPEARGSGVGRALTAHVIRWAHENGHPGDDDRLADDESLGLALLAEARLPPGLPAGVSLDSVRVPLLSGTSLVVVDVPKNGVVLRPPPPVESNADVRAAVRDALRFPLAGQPLAALAPRGGRATIVVEPPSLPLPAAQQDPRQEALEAASAELERAGIPAERQTLLVASGLMRRPDRRSLEHLGIVSPGFARRFAGTVRIHDAEDPELGRARRGRHGSTERRPRAPRDRSRRHRQRGGDGAARRALPLCSARRGAEALRAANAVLAARDRRLAQGWRLALAARAPRSRSACR